MTSAHRYLHSFPTRRSSDLHIKDYDGYLAFIGNNDYTIEDGAGNSAAITVKSMDKSKLEITLEASIGTAFKLDRKSTRLNSSHGYISYAVFCLKKKKFFKIT